jgi:hypothetical protein
MEILAFNLTQITPTNCQEQTAYNPYQAKKSKGEESCFFVKVVSIKPDITILEKKEKILDYLYFKR